MKNLTDFRKTVETDVDPIQFYFSLFLSLFLNSYVKLGGC